MTAAPRFETRPLRPPAETSTPCRTGGRWWNEPLVWALVAITAAINACGITWGLPNQGADWAIDSVAPFGPLVYAHNMLYGGQWWSKYPPLHFTLLSLLYAPYVGFLALTGRFDLGAALEATPSAVPEVSIPLFILLARSVSATMGVGATVAAYLIARELADRRAGFLAGLFFAVSPLAIYYADAANLDMPYMFWSSLALLALVRIARGAALATYVALGACTAAAIATKDQAYGMFLLLPIPLLAMHPAGVRDRRLIAGAVAAVVTYLVAANVLVDPAGWWAHLRFITQEGSEPYQMFPATLAGYGALALHTARLVVRSLTVPVVALALVGMVWARRHRAPGSGLLLFAAVSYLALFPGLILYVFPRFVLPVVFVLAIFAGIAGSLFWASGRPLARGALAASLLYAFAYGATMNLGLLWDSRYAAEAWMAQNLPPGASIGTSGQSTYLPRLPGGVVTTRVEMTPDGPVFHDIDGEPDYLLLSDAHYVRYLRKPDLRPVLESLIAGHRGWEPVATFHQPHLAATALIPSVNPRIVLLQRRHGGAG